MKEESDDIMSDAVHTEGKSPQSGLGDI